MTPAFWKGKRVLVTGTTGFKGAWLALWLDWLGAKAFGLGLVPDSNPNLYDLVKIGSVAPTMITDINDRAALARAFDEAQPDIVFHLAAQALVRPSYQDPVGTFATNVLGIVNLLDAVRNSPDVRSVVIVTSDKCYENREWEWGYRETDALGGRDPYSASKGCAEIAAASMQKSYFAPYAKGGHPARVATVRAGNVIGGGDWSAHRLVPDIVRGCLGPTGAVGLRNPRSVRPWQHVLEPLRGYLEIAEKLVTSPDGFDEAWNFGPDASDDRPVIEVAEALVAALGTGRVVKAEDVQAPHEARLLRLDCSKAKSRLGWVPMLAFEQAVDLTTTWYSAWNSGKDMLAFTRNQINDYEAQIFGQRTRAASA